MVIAAYIRNLVFLDKLETAARLGDNRIVPARPAEFGDSRPTLVVVDLTEPGWEPVVDAARSMELPVLAFGPHIRADLFDAARARGVRRAVANSKFAEALPALLTEFIGPGGAKL